MKETTIRISDDRSQAFLYLAPKPEGKYTKQELIKLLEAHGVIAGLNTSNLAAMANKGVYDREICVAKRIDPVEGKDGYYEYAFEVDARHEPKIRDDGTVDYASMNVIQSISKGGLLARYHASVEGADGKDVCGNVIPVSKPKELPELTGKGIKRSDDDPNVFVATEDGKIDFKDGKLQISKIYRIKGDVDRVSGDVDFDGDLVVGGNVAAGAMIKCAGTLTIEGTVESAILYADSDIVLQRGIQGNNKGKIFCKGSIYADFLEQASIEVLGDVETNSIINCQIHAGGKVVLTGKKGQLLGGTVHAAKGIDCKMLGNEAESKTNVHVGCEREIFTEQVQINKRVKKLNVELEKLEESQRAIEAKLELNAQSSMPDAQLRMDLSIELETVTDSLEAVRVQMKECTDRQKEIADYMQETKGSVVRVDGKVYRGVVIGIGQAMYTLEKDNCFMEYRNVSGMIAGNVIVTK